MTRTLESLTPAQLAAVYNHHASPPVKKFENRAKGARRVAALLARIEVDQADAIDAVFPDAAETTYPQAMPAAAAIMADVHAKLEDDAPDPDWTPADVGYGDKIEDDERLLFPSKAETAEADHENDETFRQAAEDVPELPTTIVPAVEAQARWLGFTSMHIRNNDQLDFKEVSIASLLSALDAAYYAGHAAGVADAAKHGAPKPAKAPRAAATAPTGSARALIIEACSRAEGATAAELFATTGWKYASWSHQLKLITTKTGTPHEIRKVDGTTRYFLGANA